MSDNTYTPRQLALIEKNRDINVECGLDWSEPVTDDFKTVAEAFGFEQVDIRWSGFWSQGDGASFTFKTTIARLLHDGQAAVASGEYGFEDSPTNYASKFKALYDDLFDRFGVEYSLTHLGTQILEDCALSGTRCNYHYSHALTVRVIDECNVDEADLDAYPTLCDKLFGSRTDENGYTVWSSRYIEGIDKHVEGIANALYRALEEEYDYRTSDEVVWEAIANNDLDKEDDEDEEVWHAQAA